MNQKNLTTKSGTWIAAILIGPAMLMGADMPKLQQLTDKLIQTELIEKNQVIEFAQQHNIPIRQKLPNGHVIELQKIENGIPLYYTTNNADAAISTRTNYLWNTPYSVTGYGYSKLGEWDEGAVRTTHQEFTSRVTQMDTPSGVSDHATHVAGTLIAKGVEPQAKGMAYRANLKAYDWDNDSSEMATAALNGMEVSNHSYSYITGWNWDGANWRWFGNTSVNQNEDYGFGFYDTTAHDWDSIAYNAPYYLIVKAAGNDRTDTGASGSPHYHGSDSVTVYTDTHNSDGYDNGGFDTIPWFGVAKNILTVGAVYDVANYSSPSDVVMSNFSGWGPTDDGRIKPDIVGNGIDLYSSIGTGDADYASYSGTSMASPNVAGTLALLQQYYQNTHNSSSMYAATLKALVLHTADEAGTDPGPDYKFGWGLLNAEKAAEKIQEDINQNVIDEKSISNGGSYTRDIVLTQSGTELKVTIVWTDPAGTPVSASLDPSNSMLVNDLDLKIVKDGTTTYYPWKLDKNNPTNAATNDSENNVDNVEQVYIDSPTAGTYQIIVDHDGTLSSAQNFSIIISGIQNQIPTADAGADKSTTVNQSVTITGSGTDPEDGTNVTYEWKEGTTVLSTNASFDYTPTTSGTHTLTLTVTDTDEATDSDTMTVTATSASSSGGGGCTYNPNIKSVDFMFVVMLMMSLFYPLRRRYLR